MLGATFLIGFWHSYRVGRVTLFTICFVWLMPLALAIAVTAYARHLSDADRGALLKAMPGGFNLTGILTLGWFNGLIAAVLAVGTRKAIRKEPLFMPRNEGTKK